MREKEKERISDIAKVYFSEDLLGPNEQYYLTLRDLLIPHYGGESALELGCGNSLWTKVLCPRYEFVDVVEGSDLRLFFKCNLIYSVELIILFTLLLLNCTIYTVLRYMT